MVDVPFFPAEFALAGKFEDLVDWSGSTFTEQIQTINLRIEVFGVLPSSSLDSFILCVYSGQGTRDGEHW